MKGLHMVKSKKSTKSLHPNPYHPAQLVSTSYDGTSRIFDMEKQQHTLLYGDEGRDDIVCVPIWGTRQELKSSQKLKNKQTNKNI